MRFFDHRLADILESLRDRLASVTSGETIEIEVPRPELKGGLNEGAPVSIAGQPVRPRSLRAWGEVAEMLGCRLLTPCPLDAHWMTLPFQKLDPRASWHELEPASSTEKYGTGSPFAAVDKREDPTFLSGFTRAVHAASVPKGARVLDLGVNAGDEYALLKRVLPADIGDAIQFVGIDHSQSAIEAARSRFAAESAEFVQHDINQLVSLGLGRFHLIISIDTFQSPGVDFKPVLRTMVQKYLEPRGAVILGFPNCRYLDGEVIYGAKMKNYRDPELSLIIKDIYFAKKYLQQHRFKVLLFGKHYLFLVGARGE